MQRRRGRLGRAAMTAAAALLLLASAARADGPPRLLRLFAEGGDLRASLSDGQVLRGADLVGATLDFGTPDGPSARLRIEAAEPERGGHAPDVWLFTIADASPSSTGANICAADPDGRRLAIPYPAPDAPGGFALTCSSGAVGKCIRFGYRPWATAPDRTSLAPLHAACVRMVRADYGGDQRGWTRDGMRIDLWDRHGIQQPEPENPMPFEAGWTPDGAVCVAHPRLPGSLAAIAEAAPRLAGRVGPDACTEATARAAGALLFNRSAAR